jgi:hypothetical protein
MADENSDDLIDPKRRSFMKRSALASGALALGVSASGTAAAQEGEEALVFAYDYWPETPFLVINQLQTSTTVDILNGINDEGIPEISRPDDFNGYVVNYRMNDDGPGLYTAVFTEASLQTDELPVLGRGPNVQHPAQPT